MNKRLAERWAKALESGKYSRGITRLYFRNPKPRHCCLGVLRHLVTGKNSGNSKEELLTRSFAEECGLGVRSQNKLAIMNDSSAGSFKKIAKFIRKNYQSLIK